MSEISVTMDVDATSPVTLRCRCRGNADDRISLVRLHSPLDKTIHTSTEIGVSNVHIWLRALCPPPLPSIIAVCMSYTVESAGSLYCPVTTTAVIKWHQLTGVATSIVHSQQETANWLRRPAHVAEWSAHLAAMSSSARHAQQPRFVPQSGCVRLPKNS